MDIQKIKELALVNGFKLKEQASGNMDLNAYVYDFANAIEQEAKAQAVPYESCSIKSHEIIINEAKKEFIDGYDIAKEDEYLLESLVYRGVCIGKAQAVPEGFVLVPKEKISYFWQDNDEPENFCSNESDFDCLGDCIDLGEIIEINKFTQAHVNKEKLFGTWFAEAIDPSEKANFFVGTHAECLEIVAKNKAMVEAQEQSHE